MLIINNTVKAENGKILKTSSGYLSELVLGEQISVINGEILSYNLGLDDIKEVNSIQIDDKVYYIESTTYPEMVTELIRQKYTLDAELALYANSRLNPESKAEGEFQLWRKKCKEAAKQWIKMYQCGGE